MRNQVMELRQNQTKTNHAFSSDPGIWGPIFWSGCLSVCPSDLFENLTDVILADDDTNPILTDNDNVAMQVTQPGGQLC